MKKLLFSLFFIFFTLSLGFAVDTFDLNSNPYTRFNKIQLEIGYTNINFKVPFILIENTSSEEVDENIYGVKEERFLDGLSFNLGYNRLISEKYNIDVFAELGLVVPFSKEAVVNYFKVEKTGNRPFWSLGINARIGVNKTFKLSDKFDLVVGAGIFSSTITSFKNFYYASQVGRKDTYSNTALGITFNIESIYKLSETFSLGLNLKPGMSIFSGYDYSIQNIKSKEVTKTQSWADSYWDFGITWNAGLSVIVSL